DHTGDKSPLALANRAIGGLDKADKATAGKIVGKSRGQVKQAHDARVAELEAERDAAVLGEEAIDVTLPTGRRQLGARHPRRRIQEQVADYFIRLGRATAERPDL